MKKDYLLYIGVFLAGAITTPLYLSLFNNSPELAEIEANGFGDADQSTEQFNADKVFVPNDSEEQILQDYAPKTEAGIPRALPELGRSQSPSIQVIPSPAAQPIPRISGSTQQSPARQESKSSDSTEVTPKSNQSNLDKEEQKAIAPDNQTAPNGLFHSVPANTFTPPADSESKTLDNPSLSFGEDALSFFAGNPNDFTGNNNLKIDEENCLTDGQNPFLSDACLDETVDQEDTN